MNENVLPKKISPYDSELKLIHVDTPGIFHYPEDAFARKTVCGRDATDSRMTAHRLEDQSPCVVCFAGWGPVASGVQQ